MSNWNPKKDPEPDKKDTNRYKEFIKQKYVDKKFVAASAQVSDDSFDEEQREAKKKLKKEKRENRRKQVQKAESSESDELPPKQTQKEETKQ